MSDLTVTIYSNREFPETKVPEHTLAHLDLTNSQIGLLFRSALDTMTYTCDIKTHEVLKSTSSTDLSLNVFVGEMQCWFHAVSTQAQTCVSPDQKHLLITEDKKVLLYDLEADTCVASYAASKPRVSWINAELYSLVTEKTLAVCSTRQSRPHQKSCCLLKLGGGQFLFDEETPFIATSTKGTFYAAGEKVAHALQEGKHEVLLLDPCLRCIAILTCTPDSRRYITLFHHATKFKKLATWYLGRKRKLESILGLYPLTPKKWVIVRTKIEGATNRVAMCTLFHVKSQEFISHRNLLLAHPSTDFAAKQLSHNQVAVYTRCNTQDDQWSVAIIKEATLVSPEPASPE